MTDFNDPLNDAPPKQKPIGLIAAVITFILLTLAGIWIVREKRVDHVRQESLAALDKELTAQEQKMKDQKEKLIELSAQLESMKVAIQTGRKTTAAEYNKVAAQQRTERQLYTQMAEEYNKKVAEYKKLEQ